MVTCRTIDEVIAAADAASEGEPPLSQEAADKVAAILGGLRRDECRSGAADAERG